MTTALLGVVRTSSLADDCEAGARGTHGQESIFFLAFGRILSVVRRRAARRFDYNLWGGVDAESFSRPRYDACSICIHGPGRVQRSSGGQPGRRFAGPEFNCPTSGPIASG